MLMGSVLGSLDIALEGSDDIALDGSDEAELGSEEAELEVS
jgi:hypothetical protein